MATSRRPYTYHSSSSTLPSPSEQILDETEQDALISSLVTLNTTRNTQITYLLLALPLLSCIPYLLAFLGLGLGSGSGKGGGALISVLGLSSLCSTAWMVWSFEVERTGWEGVLDGGWGLGWWKGGLGRLGVRRAGSEMGTKRRGGTLGSNGTDSPLEKFLPILDAALCLVLALCGVLASRVGKGGDEGHGNERLWSLYMGCLPGIVYAVVIVAKVTMAGVDPERELSGLKYDYKGA